MRRSRAFLLLPLMALAPFRVLPQNAPDRAKARLAAKYPGEEMVAFCAAHDFGKTVAGFAGLYEARQKQVRVVVLEKDGNARELDAIPWLRLPFELQCLDAKQAKERKRVLRESEAIRDFLHVPAGRGAVCYFRSDTETKCWSSDKDGRSIDAGGWQT